MLFETIAPDTPYGASLSSGAGRRRHARREADFCVGSVGGKNYPVENWSPGGAWLFCDGREFVGQTCVEVTLKFRLRNEIVDVRHAARIVRKTADGIAVEFLPLPRSAHVVFQSVIDDSLATEFVRSQMA